MDSIIIVKNWSDDKPRKLNIPVIMGSITHGNNLIKHENINRSRLSASLLAGYFAGLGTGALYGVRYTDMCAYRAIRRGCLEPLKMREMTYGWNIEMQMRAARAGLRILEVPMPYRRRGGGKSKVAGSVRGSLRAAFRIAATFVRVATGPEPRWSLAITDAVDDPVDPPFSGLLLG